MFVKADSISLIFVNPWSIPFVISVTALFRLSITQETALNRSAIKFVLTVHGFCDPGGPGPIAANNSWVTSQLKLNEVRAVNDAYLSQWLHLLDCVDSIISHIFSRFVNE